MENVVVVTANEKGEIFTPALNEDGSPKTDKNGNRHGFIRVEQSEINLDFAYNGGVKTKSALISMDQEAWAKVSKHYKEGMEVKGNVRIIETTESQLPNAKGIMTPVERLGFKPKTAGENGVVCTVGGKTIFRKTEYTSDLSLKDVTIAHDNTEQIKAAQVSETSKQEALNAEVK